MNIEQALKIMYEGGSVESLVSNTAYSMEKLDNGFKLYAEGLPVDLTYLTKEEMQGEFKEIYIINSQSDLDNLSDTDREDLIENTLKGMTNKRKFDKKIRGI